MIGSTQHSSMATLGDSRSFNFGTDAFSFANELVWEYRFDPDSGRTTFARRSPPPSYTHRCFVVIRAARKFLYHAQFDPQRAGVSKNAYVELVRAVMARSDYRPSSREQRILIPGYAGLRALSLDHADVLKQRCGGPWESYFLRSHWRMVFPISRKHQASTAKSLAADLAQGLAPMVHLVRFPQLTINHGMLVYAASNNTNTTGAPGLTFAAYDPNDPEAPAHLEFSADRRTFTLARNRYWAGGRVDVLHIARNAFF